MSRRYSKLLYTFVPWYTWFSLLSTWPAILAVIDEPTLTHYNHSKSVAYMRAHSWCYIFYCCLLLFSCSVMSSSLRPPRLYPTRLLCPWDFSGKKTGVDCYFLFQGVFLMCAKLLSHVWLFANLWTVALQALLSMGFSRQEYRSGFPFPLPGDIPGPGIKCIFLTSPELQADSLPLSHQGRPQGSSCSRDQIITNVWWHVSTIKVDISLS